MEESQPPPPSPGFEEGDGSIAPASSLGGEQQQPGGEQSPLPGNGTPGGSAGGAQAGGGNGGAAALEGQIAKFKRLLAMSRQRLEENQKQLADKSQLIERLTNELESAKKASSSSRSSVPAPRGPSPTTVSQQQQQQHSHHHNGSTSIPRRALLRIHEGSTVWVLFEYDGDDLPPQGSSSSSSGDGGGGAAWWRAFKSEEEVQSFLGRVVAGEPLKVPPPSLTPAASEDIREEARASVSRISEEFRKYRVRAELSMRQKEAEIKQISSSAMSAQQHRIEERMLDAEDLARQVRAQDERIAQLRAELAEQEQRWRGMYDKVVKENQMLQGAGAETALAAQWRKRYEAVMREKEDLMSKLDLSSSSSAHHHHQGQQPPPEQSADALLSYYYRSASPSPPTTTTIGGSSSVGVAKSASEQKYLDVKEEYKLYRKKALEALREKDALLAEQALLLGGGHQQQQSQGSRALAAAGGGGSSSRVGSNGVGVVVRGSSGGGGGGGPPMLDVDGDPRIQYLRNLVSKYLSTDSTEIREPTERAICTVLRFNEEEIKKMKAGRAGPALLSGAQWGLPTNLFGSSSSSSS